MSSDSSSLARSGLPIAPVQSAFKTAVHLLEAERASLLLRDPVEAVLTVVASVGIEPSVEADIRVVPGHGIAGLVAERGISLFGSVDGSTFLCIPIVTDHGVEGVLSVTNRLGGKQYGTEHLTLGISAAKHIGHLIQYGRTSVRDPVSGLPNRRAFEETMEREIALAGRMSSSFTVVFLDLDNLKTINDHYGHAVGDEVIQGIGSSLQRILRPYDFAGRVGGDEFVLLLSGANESDSGIASRVASALSRMSEDMSLPISTSLGIARYPGDAGSAKELLAVADERMYDQKRAKKLLRGVSAGSAETGSERANMDIIPISDQ